MSEVGLDDEQHNPIGHNLGIPHEQSKIVTPNQTPQQLQWQPPNIEQVVNNDLSQNPTSMNVLLTSNGPLTISLSMFFSLMEHQLRVGNTADQWFFRHVKKVFGTRKDLSILSDRHASIATTIKELYPYTQHGICIYHMEKNLQKYFPSGAILSLFYNAVTTYKQAEFRTYMSQIQQIDPKAAEYLEKEPPERWARSFHTNRRYNMLTINNVETMNSVLRKARELPIMVENITPVKFVVKNEGYQYNVDLKNMTCECLEFQTDELPCTHAMAVIDKRSLPKSIYCADWFKKQACQETYKGEILSVGNQDSWIIPQNIMDIKITLPDVKIRPGRKQIKRYRPRRESTKYTYRCGRCKFFGHTRATCNHSPALNPYSRRYRKRKLSS
ncbi:uncharacterized protein LOC132608075 [Lycium barbarum]|uniref:uncharacterized protein LOC132608075 n=1 Tax=Lycium barbarum TaxID=112863 RepID=UPI00293EC82B|nr:uncharacterized protein LOC132608075 [Lycium barbarum]